MLLLITIVVIFQDSLKNSPLQDLKPKDAPPTILTNLFDAYTIDNSIKGYKIPEYESKILIHLLARFIGPLIFPPKSNLAIERLIIYWNSEITNLFESYSSPTSASEYYFENDAFYLKDEQEGKIITTKALLNSFLIRDMVNLFVV